jgi:hypothetical protein
MNKNSIMHVDIACQEGILKKEHLEFCKGYCEKINNIETSPWRKNSSPLSFFIQHGQSKLSKIQRAIIILLHRDFFSKGNPCYLKNNNIAKSIKMDVDKRVIRRAVSELCRRNILYRIIIKDESSRSVLLPHDSFLKYRKTNNKIRIVPKKLS